MIILVIITVCSLGGKGKSLAKGNPLVIHREIPYKSESIIQGNPHTKRIPCKGEIPCRGKSLVEGIPLWGAHCGTLGHTGACGAGMPT